MKYDDASWHYGGDFPADLPREAGATHIAMFVVWAWLEGLAGELHVEDFPEDHERVRLRQETPATLFIRICDEKFTDEDLNEEGNAFAADFYGADGQYTRGPDGYLEIYSGLFPDVDTLYHVPDTWETYEKVAAAVLPHFHAWRRVRA
ncbi:MAG TPA: hypothetical protein VGO52_16890 [Hyphomonadaceae bacterium]|nr:hypothetical protein [Hyphomonadaceae bacterium]